MNGTRALDLSPFADQPPIAFASETTGVPTGIAGGSTIPTQRAINDIVAMVTVEEDHEDDLVITEHPVEYGAAITDHAFKRPSEVRVRVGWSEAGGVSLGFAQTQVGDVKAVYAQLLALQMSRNPFTLLTGKRSYRNMLVASIRIRTDARFEHSFLADVILREILLVSTQTIKGASNAQGNLASPEANQPTATAGAKQTVPVNLKATQIVDAGGTLGPLDVVVPGVGG